MISSHPWSDNQAQGFFRWLFSREMFPNHKRREVNSRQPHADWSGQLSTLTSPTPGRTCISRGDWTDRDTRLALSHCPGHQTGRSMWLPASGSLWAATWLLRARPEPFLRLELPTEIFGTAAPSEVKFQGEVLVMLFQRTSATWAKGVGKNERRHICHLLRRNLILPGGLCLLLVLS